jgi:hypothetical protein
MPHATDANLLFGVLALQDGLISPNTFIDECSARANRPEGPLADRLQRKKLIDHANRVEVDRRLKSWLDRFGGDASAALGAVATFACDEGSAVRDGME